MLQQFTLYAVFQIIIHHTWATQLGVEVFLDNTDTVSEANINDGFVILDNVIKRSSGRVFGDIDRTSIEDNPSTTGKTKNSFGFKGVQNQPVQDDSIELSDRMAGKKGKKKKLVTRCTETYRVKAGQTYKFNYPKNRKDSFCINVFLADNSNTKLTFNCNKVSLKDCGTEYLYLSDGVNEGVFCNSVNPGTVTDLDKVYMQYERDQQKKYKSSKLSCKISGVDGSKPKPPGPVGPPSPPKPEPTPTVVGRQICPKSCGKAKSFTGVNRIVGGSAASQGEYPWMVHLTFDFGLTTKRGLCGGSIINSRTIVTAAHCLGQGGVTAINVGVGDHNLKSSSEPNYQSFKATSYIIHPNYSGSSRNQHNDIAIIKLNSHIRFSSDVTPVCIAPKGDYANVNAVITGWGTAVYQDSSTLNDILHEVSVKVWTQQSCKNNYGKENYDIIDTQVCAASTGKDSCQGDSGGPLVAHNNRRWYQLGIVSYGIGCAEASYPGVYTRPVDFLPWIEKNMAVGNC